MKQILITLISEQAIPNVLFIREMQEIADAFLFLSSKAMERKNKSAAIINACGLEPERVKVIMVKEDEPEAIKKVLYDYSFGLMSNTQFHVNITGGTKLMSLAVYEFFRNLKSTFYYLPIGKNIIQQFTSQIIEEPLALNYRLTLHEYLVACGLSYEIKEKFSFTSEQTTELFEAYQSSNFQFELFPVEKAQNMAATTIMAENIRGVWFEEYIYYQLQRKYKLSDNMIAGTVKIYKDMQIPYNDNEFDVMFVNNNELNVVECKVQMSGSKPLSKIEGILHKLGAINKNFGLKTNSHIYTLSNLRNKGGRFNAPLLRKCELFNIQPPVDRTNFETSNF
jgi:hypothetical protein